MYGLEEEYTKKSKSSHTVFISTCKCAPTIYLTLQLSMKTSITNSFKSADQFVDISRFVSDLWQSLLEIAFVDNSNIIFNYCFH